MHVAVDRLAALKADQKLRADNTDSILAEAENIFDNADEYLVVAEDEMLLAA